MRHKGDEKVDRKKDTLQKEGMPNHSQNDCTPSKRKKQHTSQKSKILSYMERHGSITQADAVDNFRCYRLSARIKELRDSGIDIETISEPNEGYGTHARYFLK